MKTVFATVLGIVLSLALLEGLCQGYYWLQNRAAYDPARLLGAIGASPTPATGQRLPDLYTDQREVLHPYTGYGRDYNETFRKHYGYETDHDLLVGRGPGRLVIGLFGGSVAMHLHAALEAAFAKALARAGDSRQAVLVNFALGGYKQPQQLMTLNYFLALGATFDLVVNLDGFNEVALSQADNLAQGVSPYYPRLWNLRLAETPDAERLRLLGVVAADRKSLEAVVEGLRRPVLSRSAIWGLWAQFRAARLQRDIAAANQALAGQAGHSFAQDGPPFPPGQPAENMRAYAAFWARCSRLMEGACRASGIDYFHFLQPNQYLAGSKVLTEEEKATAYAPDQPYSRAAALGYPALIAAGRELAAQGVPFFDATGIFTDRGETIYQDACCHLNAAGNALLAEFIVSRVLAKGGQ